MDSELKHGLLVKFGGAFTYALERTMAFEGGWSNHPSDRGGRTKYGVTQGTLDAYNDRMGRAIALSRLTPDQAADVYWIMYWLEMRIDKLPSIVQGLMFDWSVHAGFFAIRSMQRHVKTKADGAIGPVTLAALDKFIFDKGNGIVRALAIRRMKHLCRLVRRDRKQGDFIVGWFDRVSYWLQ